MPVNKCEWKQVKGLELDSRLELWALLVGPKQVINCGSRAESPFVFNSLINGETFKPNLSEWK